MPKIAIVIEGLDSAGGMAKAILTLATELKKRDMEVDIYAGVYKPEATLKEFANFKIRTLMKKRLPMGLNALYMRYIFSKMKLKGYDGFVIYGFNSIAFGKNNHPNVWWSTNPLDHIYGIKDGWLNPILSSHVNKYGLIKRSLFNVYTKILRMIDQQDIKGVDRIFAVGPIAQKRLQKAYPKKKIEILYSPTDTKNIKYISKGSYYLSIARLVPDKNVDKIVTAFQSMPKKKLYVVGDGPMREHIESLAKGRPNIKLLGFLEESKLRELIGKSIAVMGMCENEDFSMNFMESLSAGKPTISLNTNREVKKMTLTETGVLIHQPNTTDISEAVNYMTASKSESMKKNCQKKSQLFSIENHIDGILSALNINKYKVK